MRLVAVVCLSLLLCWWVAGGQTVPTQDYLTWDADIIDIEKVSETGAGVYVVVLDTGLAPNWRDYFAPTAIAAHLGTGFEQPVTFRPSKLAPCGMLAEVGRLHQSSWVGSVGSTHGTHVASTILGYRYRDREDALAGYDLPAIQVRGLAPDATVIPIKVLGDLAVPAMPACGLPASLEIYGTPEMLVAGINHAVSLFAAGYRPMVMNLSLGGSPDPKVREAIDRAIASGIIVVAAAGNGGAAGMTFPGAHPPVISVGYGGWVRERLYPGTSDPGYRMWWLQHPALPEYSGDVDDPAVAEDVYVSSFSSRALLPDQELDLIAPGSWVRGPYPRGAGYSHLPWWSSGVANLRARHLGNFYEVAGSSMAAPHVAAVAALMLQRRPDLTQSTVQGNLKSSALALPATAVRWNPGESCLACDAVGAGLVRTPEALAAAARQAQ